jgi:hypothetical protein
VLPSRHAITNGFDIQASQPDPASPLLYIIVTLLHAAHQMDTIKKANTLPPPSRNSSKKSRVQFIIQHVQPGVCCGQPLRCTATQVHILLLCSCRRSQAATNLEKGNILSCTSSWQAERKGRVMSPAQQPADCVLCTCNTTIVLQQLWAALVSWQLSCPTSAFQASAKPLSRECENC